VIIENMFCPRKELEAHKHKERDRINNE